MSEWISVKERLPEQGVEVLVHDFVGGMGVMSLRMDAEEDLFWAEKFSGYEFSSHDVTRWMPLPEPPRTDVCRADCKLPAASEGWLLRRWLKEE